MNLIKTTSKTNPLYVGEFRSQQECAHLTANFRKSFPDEITSVNIKRSVIQNLLDNENVSGIRFMYGLGDKNDAASRVIILMPCNFTMQGNIPNVIFNKSGFYTHNGDMISLDDACGKQVNHVFRMKSQNPEIAYTKILRGYFLGKAGLLELINRVTDEYVSYNFGYDITSNSTLKPVIRSIDGDDDGLDHGKLCPPDTDCGMESDITCVATYVAEYYAANKEGELNILRGFRDIVLNENLASAAIEKYYTISASIMEQLYKDVAKTEVAQTLYHNYFKTSVASLVADDKAQAFRIFEECMQYLTDKYLYQ
ncbi:MAG: hypothetical protein ABIN91_20215 [Mucilaginibacter sp.]|uniref:hypothetical protein n=1 Tax=Mucilaginibacter sp. TaxID=1882438 RepID=UPI00326745E5